MSDPRRVAQREVAEKDVNDAIVEGLGAAEDGTVSVLCECGREECEEWIAVTMDSFSRTQNDDTLFVVAVGHERPEHEQVVERHPTYLVVNKVGEAGAEADRIDDHEERR